jgi:L-serine dehydratase
METISVFDMLKIGVGPSSSHTLGPWRAVQRWIEEMDEAGLLQRIDHMQVHLYGSLALTGRGHGTDKAICLGLLGMDPETIDPTTIDQRIDHLCWVRVVNLGGKKVVPFDPVADIVYLKSERLDFHSNGMRFVYSVDGERMQDTYYSIGGGFIVREGEQADVAGKVKLPYPCQQAADLQAYCNEKGMKISEMVWANEQSWKPLEQVNEDIWKIWEVMRDCIYLGCHTKGQLPGGLNVKRRAYEMNARMIGEASYENVDEWIQAIRGLNCRFSQILKWVSCFALAVNEENANLGRVVTAPTNGAAGVIPAVLMYYICFSDEEVPKEKIKDFLMVAGEIGTFFKKKATISAAMGGCQAEIGVSSAMAAAALCEVLGGSVDQCLMAAEIAMEHHLGMTCDPIGGLVQIPCIERNSMGAVKAINAAELALESDPKDAKVSLDQVIQTMWDTARDMNNKYKETSEGGLAVNIPVNLPEC